MKRVSMISVQRALCRGLSKALTVLIVIGAFGAVFSTTALGREFGSLPPLSEAALKFSPGHLVSDKAKNDEQFVLLNQLLVIDELILKQQKMMQCPPIDLESICEQVRLLYKVKKKVIGQLTGIKCELFQPLDILVTLEIVDDLLFVQGDVRQFLYYFLSRYKALCKIDDPSNVHCLVDRQKELLKKTKETLIKCFDKINP